MSRRVETRCDGSVAKVHGEDDPLIDRPRAAVTSEDDAERHTVTDIVVNLRAPERAQLTLTDGLISTSTCSSFVTKFGKTRQRQLSDRVPRDLVVHLSETRLFILITVDNVAVPRAHMARGRLPPRPCDTPNSLSRILEP